MEAKQSTFHVTEGDEVGQDNQLRNGPAKDPDEDDLDDVDLGDHVTDDEEEQYEPTDNLKKIWERDVQDALALEQRIQSEECPPKEARKLRKQFVEERNSNWTRRKIMSTGQNFLHFLASSPDVKAKKLLVHFVAQVVSSCPEQMGEMGDDQLTQTTPLTRAIASNNDKFVFAICQLKKQRDTIRGNLLKEAREGNGLQGLTTCLHATVTRGLKSTAKRNGGLALDLFKGILQLAPVESFTVMDSRGLSPLHLAISSSRDVAEEVIAMAPEGAFVSKDSIKGWTPLHAAIVGKHDDRISIVKLLIDKCPKALLEQDASGRTPLHLAVEYDKCSEGQLAIVEAIISKGRDALKINLTVQELSPFQYHEHTRRLWKEKAAASEKERVRPIAIVPKEAALQVRGDADSKTSGRSESRRMGRASHKDRDGTNMAMANSSARRGSNGSIPRPSMNRAIPVTVGTPSSADPTVPKRAARVIEPLDLNEEWANKIRDRLKLEYLRTMKPQEALKFLRLKGTSKSQEQDKLFWFDFGPKPVKPITEENLDKQFGHLVFDNILKYIAIPGLDLGQSNDVKGRSREGRENLTAFFQWLRDRKVNHIIRLEVDDMTTAHSDQAIEDALRGFSITTLDWRKPDLCPQILLGANVAALEEIHLYWSGRNPVLYGWSEKEEGLCKIKTLKRIFIHQVERYESPERTRRYMANFEARMKEYQVTYIDTISSQDMLSLSEPGITGSSSGAAKAEGPTPHQWLKCMGAFADKFKNIPRLRERQEDNNLNCVRVALIDDGCESLGERFLGESFNEYRTREREWRVSPYWQSASGHGTLMASLIRRICPSADIYVIRLKTFDTVDSTKIQIDPLSAIEAIRHAVSTGVQIISMSWTIKPPEDAKIRDEFENAVREAEKKGILMFCSASDQGKFPDASYPHSASIQHIFRVGAGDAMGVTSHFVDDAKVDFIFPGEDVTIDTMFSDDVRDQGSQSFKAMSYTGSSVATALAAGLSALVFECVRLGVLHSLEQSGIQFPLLAKDLKGLRTKEGMKAALKRIGNNAGRNDKYLNVWETFEEGATSLERADTRDEQLAAIAELARVKLLSKIQ